MARKVYACRDYARAEQLLQVEKVVRHSKTASSQSTAIGMQLFASLHATRVLLCQVWARLMPLFGTQECIRPNRNDTLTHSHLHETDLRLHT